LAAFTQHFSDLGGVPPPLSPAQTQFESSLVHPALHAHGHAPDTLKAWAAEARLGRGCRGDCCDVHAALISMENGKAAGVDRLAPQCLKEARAPPPTEPGSPRPHLLVNASTALFNHILRCEEYPAVWCTTTLTPH
jgi:hypothetical protein